MTDARSGLLQKRLPGRQPCCGSGRHGCRRRAGIGARAGSLGRTVHQRVELVFRQEVVVAVELVGDRVGGAGSASVRACRTGCRRPARRSRRSAAPAGAGPPCSSAPAPGAAPAPARRAPAGPARGSPGSRRATSRWPETPTGRAPCAVLPPRSRASPDQPRRSRTRSGSPRRRRRSAGRVAPATPRSFRSGAARAALSTSFRGPSRARCRDRFVPVAGYSSGPRSPPDLPC